MKNGFFFHLEKVAEELWFVFYRYFRLILMIKIAHCIAVICDYEIMIIGFNLSFKHFHL